jgi:predicted Zn-dependent protease with MMP-like domain
VTPQVFHKHVAKALEEIPEEFQEKMENVEVLIEDFADPETLGSLGLESPWQLLGLYVGVPLNQRSVFAPGYLPERIYLYRRPILRAAGGTQNVVSTIREVVIHEVGHHFGFDDDELERMAGRTK